MPSSGAEDMRKRPQKKRTAKKNLPLIGSNHKAARCLAEPPLFSKLIIDINEMDAKAASYIETHPYLTAEMMQRWGCGWMPNDGVGSKGEVFGVN